MLTLGHSENGTGNSQPLADHLIATAESALTFARR